MTVLVVFRPQSIKINTKLTFNPPPPDTEVLIACFSTSSCFFLFLSTASGFLTPLYTVWKSETNGWKHKPQSSWSDMHLCWFVQETVTDNKRAFHCQISSKDGSVVLLQTWVRAQCFHLQRDHSELWACHNTSWTYCGVVNSVIVTVTACVVCSGLQLLTLMQL